jgi:hypothetical protein
MTDEVGTPSLSVKGVRRFYEDHFDVADLEARFGRLPSAFTFRRWVRARGVPSDRRPDDFASSTGQVPRARKINSMVLAIIKFWALKYHTKPKQFKNAYFRKAKDDVERYAKGEALELHDFQDVELDAPKGVIKMCSRRIFDMEVERAKGSQAFKEAWGLAAVRQRYRGGGWSQEPTRFLEIVQLDDTPFPVFAVDPVRGVPCGVPTVTIALCIFTRVIVGWDISYDPPSHVTFMRTLLHTAVPKIVPEPFAKITELGDLHGKVVGVLLVDHAKHLSARAAQDAGGEIGTAVRWAGSKQPTHKGCVERCLKTLQDMICAELKGGTGTSPHAGVRLRPGQARRRDDRGVPPGLRRSRRRLPHHWPHRARRPRAIGRLAGAEGIHGLDTVGDIDVFERAICNVDWPSFRGQGAEIGGLMYGTDGTDDEFPSPTRTSSSISAWPAASPQTPRSGPSPTSRSSGIRATSDTPGSSTSSTGNMSRSPARAAATPPASRTGCTCASSSGPRTRRRNSTPTMTWRPCARNTPSGSHASCQRPPPQTATPPRA